MTDFHLSTELRFYSVRRPQILCSIHPKGPIKRACWLGLILPELFVVDSHIPAVPALIRMHDACSRISHIPRLSNQQNTSKRRLSRGLSLSEHRTVDSKKVSITCFHVWGCENRLRLAPRPASPRIARRLVPFALYEWCLQTDFSPFEQFAKSKKRGLTHSPSRVGFLHLFIEVFAWFVGDFLRTRQCLTL